MNRDKDLSRTNNNVSAKPKRKRRLRWRKEFVLVCTLLVLVIGAIGGTVAWLVASSGPVTNTFTYAKQGCEIEENFDKKTKKDVCVKNTGDTKAYIRAAVVITWTDESGNAYSELPQAGKDYVITWGSSKWTKASDGFYYYDSPVDAGSKTENLISKCESSGTEPDGYTLNVEILAQSIQSLPEEAVQQSWGVTVNDDGTISKD